MKVVEFETTRNEKNEKMIYRDKDYLAQRKNNNVESIYSINYWEWNKNDLHETFI